MSDKYFVGQEAEDASLGATVNGFRAVITI